MIKSATLKFRDGSVEQVEKVMFKDGGWIGAYFDGAWNYYPPYAVSCVRSRSGAPAE